MPDRHQARRPVDRRTVVVAPALLGCPGMEGHTHAELRLTPQLGLEGALSCHSGCEGVGGFREGSVDTIAGALDNRAPMRRDRVAQQGVMARESCRHCLRVALPELRTVLEIGEQPGDRAGRQCRRPVGRHRGHAGQPINRQLAPRDAEEGGPLRRRDLQHVGQPCSDLLGGPPLVRLDLADGDLGTADQSPQLGLAQFQHDTAQLDPPTQRGDVLHTHLLAHRAGRLGGPGGDYDPWSDTPILAHPHPAVSIGIDPQRRVICPRIRGSCGPRRRTTGSLSGPMRASCRAATQRAAHPVRRAGKAAGPPVGSPVPRPAAWRSPWKVAVPRLRSSAA